MEGWGAATTLNGAIVCSLKLCLWSKWIVINTAIKSFEVNVREATHKKNGPVGLTLLELSPYKILYVGKCSWRRFDGIWPAWKLYSGHSRAHPSAFYIWAVQVGNQNSSNSRAFLHLSSSCSMLLLVEMCRTSLLAPYSVKVCPAATVTHICNQEFTTFNSLFSLPPELVQLPDCLQAPSSSGTSFWH